MTDQTSQQAVKGGPKLCPTCGVRHRSIAPDSPLAKAHRAAVESERDNLEGMAESMRMFRADMIKAGVIGDSVPPMFMSEAILGAIGKARAEALEQSAKPSDCSNDPSSCPDNAGSGCYCTDNKLLPCPSAQADKDKPCQ